MAPGELERQPGIDRPEGDTVGQVRVANQPLDLGTGEVGVDHQSGPLTDQLLMALLAKLVAAGSRATVLPDERAMHRLARLRIPGDDGLSLVGDPDSVQVGSLDRGVRERRNRDLSGHLPDLGGVVLHPAGTREVLLELAVAAPTRAPLLVKDDARRPGGALVDGQDHLAGTLSGAPPRGSADVPELACAVEKASGSTSADPVRERKLDLPEPISGPDRVDGHTRLHPPTIRERNELAQGREPHRPLAGEGRRRPSSTESLDRPARVTERDAEAPSLRIREGRHRQVAIDPLDRVDKRHELPGALPKVRVAEQDRRLVTELADCGLRRRRHVGPLTVRPAAAHDPGAAAYRGLCGP